MTIKEGDVVLAFMKRSRAIVREVIPAEYGTIYRVALWLRSEDRWSEVIHRATAADLHPDESSA